MLVHKENTRGAIKLGVEERFELRDARTDLLSMSSNTYLTAREPANLLTSVFLFKTARLKSTTRTENGNYCVQFFFA